VPPVSTIFAAPDAASYHTRETTRPAYRQGCCPKQQKLFAWQHRNQIMQAQSRAGLFVAGKPRLLQSVTRYLHADFPDSMARCGTE